METETVPPISLNRFLLRTWIWQFGVTLTFFILLVMVVRPHYADFTATHQDLIINLISLILCSVHTLLILIFSMRRFFRKEVSPGLIFLLHFLLSASLTYYGGWLFFGGVFHEIIPG